jgi:hypothetical protein
MSEIIECAGRRFVALRKASGRSLSIGNRAYHAVLPHCALLCRTRSRSWWANAAAERMTCPECLRRLIKLRNLVCNASEPCRTVTKGAFCFDNVSTVLCNLEVIDNASTLHRAFNASSGPHRAPHDLVSLVGIGRRPLSDRVGHGRYERDRADHATIQYAAQERTS